MPTPADIDPVEWLSLSIDADRWLSPEKLASPKEAALALCGCHPDDARAANPFARVSPVLAVECERLFHHLSKVKDADLRVRRTLTDWWKIARADDFGYAPHFDRLVQSRSMDSLSDKRTGLAKRIVLREQEDRILQAIVELGYTPKSLPKSGPAVSGVKAGIAHHLTHCLTRSAFRKAWDRLRDSKQIAYGLEKKHEGPTERSFDS